MECDLGLNPKKVVALDIGSTVVKAVQLRKVGRSVELDRFGTADIYPGTDKHSSPIDPREAKTEAVRRAITEAGISAKYAVSAVSGESIIVRYIQLPEMPENELKGAIRWEAEDYIPFPLDEVTIDSMILGRTEAGGAVKLDVLLVAAKKDLINDHMTILRGASLQPVIIDVDAFAFLNCFEENYKPSPDETVALLNIGAELTNINIYNAGVSRFSRDIPVAGDTVTDGIVQRLNCSYSRAEEMKLRHGAPMPGDNETLTMEADSGSSLLDTIRGTVERITGEDLGEESPELVVEAVIRSVLGNLTNEVRRSIQFYENQPNGKPVQRLAMGGGMSMMKNLDQYLSGELGLQVEVIDPLRSITVPKKDSDRKRLEAVRPLLGVAVGLGLRAFD